MTVEYITLTDYIAIAVEVTGLDLRTVLNVTNFALADSALHAPQSGFGDTDHYDDFIDKAAILLDRLTRNHPLLDGNKRAAWVSLRLFVEINEWTWNPTPTIDDAETAVLAIASGEWTHQTTASWLRNYLRPAPENNNND